MIGSAREIGPATTLDKRERSALELAHHHPGRLRLRSDLFWETGDDDLAERVCNALEAVEGVSRVTVNARSGSILVEYEPAVVDPNVLIAVLAHSADLGLPIPPEDMLRKYTASGVTIGAARKVNGLTDRFTGGRADLRAAVPIGLAGLAAFSFFALPGRLPRWDNLVYWAFAVFQALHTADIARTRARVADPPP
jgi:copper chaperone CopZ